MGNAQPTDLADAKGAPLGALTPVVVGATTSGATQPAPMSAPCEIRLAGAVNGVRGAPVQVTPAAITLAPDPAGPLGQNTLSLSNGSTVEQTVWLSYELPDVLSVAVEQPAPSGATLRATVDLANAASLGAQAPTQARIYVTTATGTTVVTVSWRPMPYGRM